MPICSWCGIESKNDLVCDWCKRPLALRAARRPSGVDLLSDGNEESGSTWTPRVIAITAIISLCLIAIVVWAVSKRGNDIASAPVEQMTPMRDQLVERSKAVAPTTPGAPAQLATPVFLPVAQPAREPASVDDRRMGGGTNLNIGDPSAARGPGGMATINLVGSDDNGATRGDRGTVKLSAGLLRLNGQRRVVSGRVAIVNASEHVVVDFRLEADINGKTYLLTPYEGTVDKPRPLKTTSIGPGEKVSVPVLITKFGAGRKSGIVQAKINLEAWLDGEQGVKHDQILTP